MVSLNVRRIPKLEVMAIPLSPPWNAKVLLVDDDPLMAAYLERCVEKLGMGLDHAKNGTEGNLLLQNEPLGILLDLHLENESGFDLLRFWQSSTPHIPVIVITSEGTPDNAMRALRLGATDFLTKPIDPIRLEVILKNIIRMRELQFQVQNINQGPQRSIFHGLVGHSPPMQQLYTLIETLAKTEATLLIEGPSGSGKELVAKAVHSLSRRADQPFVAINCGAIHQELLESELFGHLKGAFTGAERDRAGLFEQASQGTLFLDEIGEISQSMQVKLLRVLQEKTVRRLGANEDIKVNTRVLAATNRNLKSEVEKGTFREDLFYRLEVVTLRIPPLLSRKQDIPILTEFFLDSLSKSHQIPPPKLNDDLKTCLLHYHWPGNVRQLRNLIERLVVLYSGQELGAGVLPPEFLAFSHQDAGKEKLFDWPTTLELQSSEPAEPVIQNSALNKFPTSEIKPDFEQPWPRNWPIVALETIKKYAILHALDKADWDVTQAAKWLGLSRSTLYRQIQEQNLTPPA